MTKRPSIVVELVITCDDFMYMASISTIDTPDFVGRFKTEAKGVTRAIAIARCAQQFGEELDERFEEDSRSKVKDSLLKMLELDPNDEEETTKN